MEWRCRRLPAQLPGYAAPAATTGNYGDRAFADGQWKCRLACHLLPGTLHQLLVTIVVGLVGWAMGNGE